MVIGQEGVDVSFEREKEHHHCLVEENYGSQVLGLLHRQQISLIFPELRDCPGLPCPPLDGECELDDVKLDDTEQCQAHQRRFQGPGGAFIVLPGTQTSNGDISEELGVRDEVAEDVSERDCAANDELQPEENVEILEVGAGLVKASKYKTI